MIIPLKAFTIVDEMRAVFSSEETLVNPIVEELDDPNSSPADHNATVSVPSASLLPSSCASIVYPGPIRQHILRYTRALKQSSQRRLQSAKHGLVRMAKKMVGRS
ncbi:hypothetical protein QCA50_012622 [Cerrena zonata]|uniref:Uncharacterized protein n=1 Tax=Cerrena zonata TaxID=2478898 RepID=A0AAW0FTC1_9APHY